MPGFGPPPPPTLNPVQTVTLKYKPKVIVRKIHWENVTPTSFEGSVWDTFKNQHSELKAKVHDSGLFTEIDNAFQIKEKSKVSVTSGLEQINVLSEKRAQNVMIFLRTLRTLQVEELVESVRGFDESRLTESMMKQCKMSLTTLDESKMLETVENGPRLRGAESFMLMVTRSTYSYR